MDPQRLRLSSRYPLIVEAALRHRINSFVLDDEAVLLGVDGIADYGLLLAFALAHPDAESALPQMHRLRLVDCRACEGHHGARGSETMRNAVDTAIARVRKRPRDVLVDLFSVDHWEVFGPDPAADAVIERLVRSGKFSSLTSRVSAIANPLRHDSLFRRHLSNITLVDQRVCGVIPHIDLGLNWCTASTEFLENIAAVCLPKVFGFAGSKWFVLRFHRGGRVNTAGHFSGDWQATGLQPIGLLAIGLE